MYLNSSNMENVAFYNFHGFEIGGKTVIGNDNPTWNGPPVVVPVVSVMLVQSSCSLLHNITYR